MGMYTEFHCRFLLKSDTPQDVIDILYWLVGFRGEIKFLPAHPFFALDIGYLFSTASSSHITAGSRIKTKYSNPEVFISTSFKNYHDEANLFLDWISPYIYKYEDEVQFLGYYTLIADEFPVFIYLNKEGNLMYLQHSYDSLLV